MGGPAGHEHVSEREAGGWWTCVYCSGIMFARAMHRRDIPATLTEAHHLASAAGATPGLGSTARMLVEGLKTRYGFDARVVGNSAALWPLLTPGNAAVVLGNPGVFPLGHQLRRWDPSFNGGHAWAIFRLDSQAHVWLDDPLAPDSYRLKGKPVPYTGQWLSHADLNKFMAGLPSGGAVIATATITNAPSGDPTVPALAITNEQPATMTVPKGAKWLDLDGKTVLATGSGQLDARYSPYGVGSLRAMYATIHSGDPRRVVLVAPVVGSVKPIVDVDAAKVKGHLEGVGAEQARIRTVLGI